MARGAGINLAGILAANALGFLYTLLVTHLVGARVIGLVALGTTVTGFATIPALLGIDTGLVRFVGRSAAKKDEREAAASLQAGLAIVGALSVALSLTIWLLAPWICDHFFHKPQATDAVRIVGLSLPGIAVSRAVMAGVQGFGLMGYAAWLGIFRRVAEVGAFVPLILLVSDLRALAVAGVVSAWISCYLSVLYLRRAHPGAFASARGERPWLSLLNFSVPQVLTAVLFFFILWTDTLLLGRYRTASEVGIYSIIGTLLGPAILVSTAVGQMFGPRIAAEDARGDREALAGMLKRVTRWNTGISIPLFALLMVAPHPLLGLFGSKYREGAAALSILAAGQLLNTAAGPLGQVLNMSGRQYLTMVNNGAVAGLNLAAAAVLIPRYGLTGAACSTAGALTFVNAIKLVEVKVIFGFHPFARHTLSLFAAAGVASAAALPLTLPALPSALLESGALAVAVFGVYALLAWRAALTDEDRDLFSAGRAKLSRTLRPTSANIGG